MVQANWQESGICHSLRNSDPEMWARFFAETAQDRRPARNLCGECPVREQCLQTALEEKQIWGVWGGCDEGEIRRALWVNSNGTPAERCRYPQCPNCKARPSKLFVVGTCELKSSRKRERVECSACGFSWRAATSVAAVKAYWRDASKKQTEKVKARVPRGRIPRERANGATLTAIAGYSPSASVEVTQEALVASGGTA